MIKLERIYVKNYKNIAEADLELGNMNVIVGENGSGKSNLLSVIPLLNFIINGDINEIKDAFNMNGGFSIHGHVWNRLINNDVLNTLILNIEFSNTDTNLFYFYEIHFTPNRKGEPSSDYSKIIRILEPIKISFESFNFKSKSKTGKSINIFKRTNNEITYGNGIKKTDSLNSIDNYVSVMRLLNLIKNSGSIDAQYKDAIETFEIIFKSNIYYLSSQILKLKEFDKSNSNRILGFDIPNEINSLLQSPQEQDYRNAIKEILNITEIKITNLFALSVHLLVNIYQNNKGKSLNELSDGSLVLLGLITKIFSDSSDIFFIEEPENSIHPRALYELMKLIREKSLDKQFIITTHSPYLLNMIKPDEVLVAEIQEDGLSKIQKLPNVKAIKKKLAKSFMSFGDIVFADPDTDEDSE